jgi:hypothetical protein
MLVVQDKDYQLGIEKLLNSGFRLSTLKVYYKS